MPALEQNKCLLYIEIMPMLDLPVLGKYKIFLTQAALVLFSKESNSVHVDKFIGEIVLGSLICSKAC